MLLRSVSKLKPLYVTSKAPQTNNAGGSSVQSSTGTGRASPVEIDDKSNMSGVIA